MRLRLRLLMPVVLIAAFLAACGDDTPPSGAGARQSVVTTPAWTAGQQAAAVAYVRAHPVRLASRWQRAVVLSAVTTGPADHLRLTVALVGPAGRPYTVESDLGETAALLLLVQPGDYITLHAWFGTLGHDAVHIIERGAVPVIGPRLQEA